MLLLNCDFQKKKPYSKPKKKLFEKAQKLFIGPIA